MVKILPEIWPSHRISNKNKGIKLLTYTQYTTLTYTSSHTHQHRRRRELQNLETRKHKFNFQFAKERTRTNTYIHTHKIHTREEDTLPYIYIERGRKKYISSWFSC